MTEYALYEMVFHWVLLAGAVVVLLCACALGLIVTLYGIGIIKPAGDRARWKPLKDVGVADVKRTGRLARPVSTEEFEREILGNEEYEKHRDWEETDRKLRAFEYHGLNVMDVMRVARQELLKEGLTLKKACLPKEMLDLAVKLGHPITHLYGLPVVSGYPCYTIGPRKD